MYFCKLKGYTVKFTIYRFSKIVKINLNYNINSYMSRNSFLSEYYIETFIYNVKSLEFSVIGLKLIIWEAIDNSTNKFGKNCDDYSGEKMNKKTLNKVRISDKYVR